MTIIVYSAPDLVMPFVKAETPCSHDYPEISKLVFATPPP